MVKRVRKYCEGRMTLFSTRTDFEDIEVIEK